jgi:hypothetical protein
MILLFTRLPVETEAYFAFRLARITHCSVANPTALVRSLLEFFDSRAIGTSYAYRTHSKGCNSKARPFESKHYVWFSCVARVDSVHFDCLAPVHLIFISCLLSSLICVTRATIISIGGGGTTTIRVHQAVIGIGSMKDIRALSATLSEYETYTLSEY